MTVGNIVWAGSGGGGGYVWQCTCPTVWLGIDPPEPCDFCRNRMTAAGGGLLPIGIAQTYTLPQMPRNVEQLLLELSGLVGARIGELGLDDAGPASDAWQEALMHLRALKHAVERARAAESAK